MIPLLVSALFVAVVAWVGITVYRRQERSAPYLRALAEGEMTVDEVPKKMQKSLADPKHRAALATSMRKIARDAARQPKRRMIPNPPVTWYFPPNVRHQISEVADLLERPETPPEAVALAELLLGDGASPFYGEREEPLVAELRRLREACQRTAA